MISVYWRIESMSETDKYREYFGDELMKLADGYKPDLDKQKMLLSEVERTMQIARKFENLLNRLSDEYRVIMFARKGEPDREVEKARHDLIIKARIFYQRFISTPLMLSLEIITAAKTVLSETRNKMEMTEIEYSRMIPALNANRIREAENEYTQRKLKLEEEFKQLEDKLRREID
jgi:hypothetical protein